MIVRACALLLALVGCAERAPGIEVALVVRMQPALQLRTVSDPVELLGGHLSVTRGALVACPVPAGSVLALPRREHDLGDPGLPTVVQPALVLSLMPGAREIATIRPPRGTYCSLVLEIGPASVAFAGLPDLAWAGRSLDVVARDVVSGLDASSSTARSAMIELPLAPALVLDEASDRPVLEIVLGESEFLDQAEPITRRDSLAEVALVAMARTARLEATRGPRGPGR